MKRIVFLIFLVLSLALVISAFYPPHPSSKLTATKIVSRLPQPVSTTPSPSPTSVPTPIPLTFKDLNQLYGPCVSLPVLMYHHIQPEAQAKQNGQTSLTVDTAVFRQQLAYLQSKNYHSVSPQDLVNFFDSHTPLPSRPVLITVDDAYSDFATDAAPLLKQFGFKATSFVPTGLVDNPQYLSWATIRDLSATGLFTFANHTWSHHSLKDSLPVITKELSLASTQLTDHGQTPKIFAYPYGTVGTTVIKYLSDNGYQLAFTTHYGWTMCQKQRFQLPRIRIGNAPLSSYGL